MNRLLDFPGDVGGNLRHLVRAFRMLGRLLHHVLVVDPFNHSRASWNDITTSKLFRHAALLSSGLNRRPHSCGRHRGGADCKMIAEDKMSAPTSRQYAKHRRSIGNFTACCDRSPCIVGWCRRVVLGRDQQADRWPGDKEYRTQAFDLLSSKRAVHRFEYRRLADVPLGSVCVSPGRRARADGPVERSPSEMRLTTSSNEWRSCANRRGPRSSAMARSADPAAS